MDSEIVDRDWKKIKEIFHEALRREPAERESYLNASCGDDLELRIEVESLLLSLDEARTFLEQPAVLLPTPTEVSWQFAAGDTVSHYRIVEPIGVGGMGQVYLAEDANLYRQVALKVLPRELHEDIDRLRRFKREALAVSALNHPNILTIFEFVDVEGVPIIASEYVKGCTLRERLKKGRLGLDSSLDIAVQVASALQTAHDAGVIHRDIKPENIMIRDDGYVKVLDFGLAKLTGDLRSKEADKSSTQAFSTPGLIIGTVTYMSPEQARSLPIDARTDIFSLGIVLYEMLAARPPFNGGTTTDVIAEIIQTDPPNASVYDPNVPEVLDRIIMRCLRKERKDRYASAGDLVTDLRALSKPAFKRELVPDPAAESIPTQRFSQMLPDEFQSDEKFGTHRPARSLAKFIFASLLLVVALGAAGAYWYFARENQIASIAVLPFTNESGNPDIEYLSDGMTESLINTLSTLPNLSVKARNTVFRYKGATIDERTVGNELAVQALLLGWITQRGDSLTLHLSLVDAGTGKHLWGEQYERDIRDLAILQREITRDVSQKLRTRLSNTAASELTKNYTGNSEAYQDYLRGRYFWNKRTAETIAKAIGYFELAIAKDPEFALAYAGLADAYVVPANRMAPRDAMPKAKAAATRALQIDDGLAEAHTSLGRVLQVYDWNWNEAEKEFRRAIQLNPQYPVAHQWYGAYFERVGRLDQAVAERRIALDLDPLSTITNFELGQAFYFNREYDKALEQFNKTLELDPEFPPALQYVPLVLAQKRMNSEALASIKPLPESSSIGTGVPGYVFAVAGREREARQELADLKRLRNETYVSAVGIAFIHAGLGERQEALSWLEKGYEERAFQMQFLKVEPRWDPFRNDPRFVDLMRRLNFPE